MKNILMIGPSLDVHGGISGVVNNLIDAGLKKKINLTYIGTMSEGSKIHKLFVAAKAYLKFICIVKKADVVHINVASDASFYRKSLFIKKAKKAGKKIIIHQHGGDIINYYGDSSKKTKQYIKDIFDMADKLLVLSPLYEEFFKGIVDQNKVILFPNAIDTSIGMLPDEYEKDYNAILFLGRICEAKGVNELLDAMKKIHEVRPDVKLYLGGIYENPEFESRVKSAKDYVEFIGWMTPENKNSYLKKCGIFTLPSYFEGQGVSILEAMNFGCGIVATNVGGIPMMIKDKENGVLVKEKDSNSLYDGLMYMLNNPDKAKEFGRNARKDVVCKFDINKTVDELVKLYD